MVSALGTTPNMVAPLLGNPTVPVGTGSAAARLTRGVSNGAADLLGLTRSAAAPISLIETQSPATHELSRAISGFFDRAQTLRDAAGTLARVIDASNSAGQYDADQIVSAAQTLADAINSLRGFVMDHPAALSAGLLGTADGATDSYELKTNLANVGITFAEDGTISVNEGQLRQEIASQPQQVAEALGLTGGLATRELDTASALLRSAAPAVIGFSGAGGAGDFLLTSATRDRFSFVGRFVDLLA